MSEIVCEGRRRPVVAGRSLFDEADQLAVAVPTSCRRSGRCRECIVEVARGAEALSARTPREAFLTKGFRLACQAVVERSDLDIGFSVLRRRLRILMPAPDMPTDLDPTVKRCGDAVVRDNEVLDQFRGHVLGLAVDIGTTTVVLELVDLLSGRSLHAAAFENPQRFGGSDVISRISYESDYPGELRRAVVGALNRELRAAYANLRLDRREVYEVVIVGNSTMRDLFFGLDVAPLGSYPFRSITETESGQGRSTDMTRRAHELGVLIHPLGHVWGAPLVASHIGADIAADLVAVDFGGHAGVSMLVDIGTNTEVVVTDGRRLLAASCPAGPAFEGGRVTYGMPGADGAIESVRRSSGRFVCRTIGDVEPEGICGSGLVDFVAESRRAGSLTAEGHIADGSTWLALVPDRGIGLGPEDLSYVAQAKAANAAGQRIVLRRLGVTPVEVDRLFLAGAFANALDVERAIEIGLLPAVAADRVLRVGNAAVRGAKALLVSRHQRDVLAQLLTRIEHVELETETDFLDLFVEGCRFEPMSAVPTLEQPRGVPPKQPDGR